jgi:hypothetical protein
LRFCLRIHISSIGQLAILELRSTISGAQLTDQDDAPVGARDLRLCSISCQPEDSSSINERAFHSPSPNTNHEQIDTCRCSIYIYKPAAFPINLQFLTQELSSSISTPHSEKLPRDSVQHGRDKSRDGCLWRGSGARGQVLGSTNRAVTGEFQDQSTARSHAASNRQGFRYPQGSGSDGQHEFWTGYGSCRQDSLKMSSRFDRPKDWQSHPASSC